MQGESSDRYVPGGPLAVESTLVHETGLFFAEGLRNVGLDRWQLRTRGHSSPRAGRTGDEMGAREVLRRGIRATI
jgi:hypothetical protein